MRDRYSGSTRAKQNTPTEDLCCNCLEEELQESRLRIEQLELELKNMRRAWARMASTHEQTRAELLRVEAERQDAREVRDVMEGRAFEAEIGWRDAEETLRDRDLEIAALNELLDDQDAVIETQAEEADRQQVRLDEKDALIEHLRDELDQSG